MRGSSEELDTALSVWRRRRAAERAARALGWSVLAIGMVVLAGWVLEASALMAPVPGLDEMKANSALALLLAGFALVLLAERSSEQVPQVLATACASGVALIGLLTLIEYLLAIDVGVDELLVKDPGAEPEPGRPAPQTALCLLLGGVALLLIEGPTRLRPFAAPLSYAVVAIGFYGLLVYLYGSRPDEQPDALMPGSPHGTVALLALGTGILLARPERGVLSALLADGGTGALARKLVPLVLLGLPLVGWFMLHAEEVGQLDARAGSAALVVATAVPLAVALLASSRAFGRAERARRKSALLQQQLASVVEQSEDAIFTTSLEGEITSWNRGAERLYGWSADEVIGQSMTVLVASNGQADGDERLLGSIARHRRKDGGLIDVSMSVSALRDEDGSTVGVSLIARDETERLRAERDAIAARADAERANHAKSEFLSRMSHELRTPLNAILGFGQLLQLDEVDERRKDNVNQIVRGGRHLLDLINEVLDISRIESGTMTVSVEPVHLDEVLAEARELVAPLAAEHGIDVAGDPAGVWACADRQRLKQVLLNLLSNAVKYNRPQGSIRVDVRQTDAGRARIAVSDTGYGIPAERIERLFKPFDRLGAEQSRVEGTGLGLALSKRLVEAMGGTIEVESQEGEGTTFTVDLALAESPLEQVREEGPVQVALAGDDQVNTGHATVLYVEDNLSNLKLVEQILRRRPGVTLIPAMQGKLGLELARRHQPQLVLLDLHLPDMPGSHVLARMRTDPATRSIPVVMLSADATHGQIERLMAVGADDYLTKPLDVGLFLELIDRTIERTEVTAS